MTRVLIAEDSPFLCRLLSMYLEQDGGFRVVGTAMTGRDALDQHRKLSPDVVALDLMMPDLDGVTILRRMQELRPTPVVVITGASGMDAVLTLRALEAGASDFVMKFDPASPKTPEMVRGEIISKMHRAARKAGAESLLPPAERPGEILLPSVAVIGASTGGPQALRQVVATLPASYPGAVVIVQHVAATFTAQLAADLDRICRLPVSELNENAQLRPGMVGVAPGGRHLRLAPKRRVEIRKFAGEPHCPSIDLAMESAAEIYGPNAIGVLLTGMGSDGVHGMGLIRNRGGKTMVQDPSTCVVAGMTGAAIARGVAGIVAPPGSLGEKLSRFAAAAAGGSDAQN